MRTLLAINCGKSLSAESRRRLVSIVGPFSERRPTFVGSDLYRKAWEVLHSLPDDQASEDSHAMRAAMDRVISEVGISDEGWQQCDIIVLLASNWNTAGIEITQIATLRAVERRKAGAIRWMVFGNDMLTDDEPMTSREEDIRALSQ